ncbi:MAG: dockerin type I domain-containing protein [candidate division Zixibacteria bacterium]|nr:dockerin type I domain-containing protein [candidate division Zixibacteria bacterium]
MGKISFIWILLGFLFLSTSNAFAATIHVPADQPTIQAGINVAGNGDTVLVAPGTYTGDGNHNISTQGKLLIIISSAGPDSTIIFVDHGEDTYTGFIINSGEDTTLHISGFSITANPHTMGWTDGGAFILHNSSATIDNCVVRDQWMGHYGGGMRIENATVIFVNCTFQNNRTGDSATKRALRNTKNLRPLVGLTFGGGIYCLNSQLFFSKCHFRENFADNGSGGGIFSISSYLNIDSCEFTDNGCYSESYEEAGFGGAICQRYGTLVISYSRFDRNNSDMAGGAIFSAQCDTSIITDCNFMSNCAWDGDAGAISMGLCNWFAMSRNNFVSNYARNGGAVSCGSQSSIIEYCTFEYNYSTYEYSGAAMSLGNGNCVIDHCLFYDNRVAWGWWGPGGSIFCSSAPVISNSIVANTKSGVGIFCFESLSGPYLSCSNIYGNDSGNWVDCIAAQFGQNGNISLDPLFCDTANKNFHINTSSPCAPSNNSCGQLIGAYDVACGPYLAGYGIQGNHILHVLSNTPTIYWDYRDLGSLLQDSFLIAVGTDSDWAFSEMWNPAPVASADTFVTYTGAPLVDGATYYMRLRVHNGSFWSLWYDTTFRMNSVPTVPVLAWPDSGAIVNTATPTLYVHNSTDAENDTINYEFAVVNDSAFGQLNEYGVSGFPEGIDSTGWQVFQSLNENWKYWWRSRAYDQYENSPWSSIKSFWVNAVEEPPGLFNINPLPETTGTVFQMLPQFHWLASSDPDPLDSVHYTLYIALDSNFLYLRTIENIQSNSYQLADSLLFATRYWWKVKATDKTGRYTYSSNTLNFRTWKLGDANGDWLVNIQDVTFLINYLYNKIPPGPVPKFVGDINGNCIVNIQDITYLINFLYKGGPSPKIGCL